MDLAVGAPLDDAAGTAAGALWILFLNADGTVKTARKIVDPQVLGTNDFFGESVASLGDVDGDGRVDIAVGAPGALGGGINGQGVTWVLFLESDGAVKDQQVIGEGKGGFTGDLFHQDRFGSGVAGLGDLDGNGVPDLAVGADRAAGDGYVWVLLLEPDGTVKANQAVSESVGGFAGVLDGGDEFGEALAHLGDLDGDGTVELGVGAPGDDDGGENLGAVWVLSLFADGTVAGHRKISALEGGFTGELETDDGFGRALTLLGDVDGDSNPDLAVGAPFDDDGGGQHGAIWPLLLDGKGNVETTLKLSDSPGSWPGSLEPNDEFGTAVAPLGDLDGDGVDDLAVATNGPNGIWIQFLAEDGTVKAFHRLESPEPPPYGALGVSAAHVGDVNADGVPDLIAGAGGDDDGGVDHGAVWRLALDGVAVVDFETGDDLLTPLADGQALAGSPGLGRVYTLASSGPNLGPAAFDSDPHGPNAAGDDPALLLDRGNLLVLQDAGTPSQTEPGVFDAADASEDGGRVSIELAQPVKPLSLDLVDVGFDLVTPVHVVLLDDSGLARVYEVPPGWTSDLELEGPPGRGTLDLATHQVAQPGFAAVATYAQDFGFDEERVVRVEVTASGPVAIDDLSFDPRP